MVAFTRQLTQSPASVRRADVERLRENGLTDRAVLDLVQAALRTTAKEPADASHKKALKFLTAQLPGLREGLKAFKDEIHSK